MNCEHKEIIIANTEGQKCEKGGNEVDLIISCHICDEELFRISEYRRVIWNLSKH